MPTLTVFPQSNRQGTFEVETPGPIGDGVQLIGDIRIWLDIDPADAALPEHEAHIEVYASPDAQTWRLINRWSWYGAITVDRSGALVTQPAHIKRSDQYTGEYLRATLNVPDRMRIAFYVDYEAA